MSRWHDYRASRKYQISWIIINNKLRVEEHCDYVEKNREKNQFSK